MEALSLKVKKMKELILLLFCLVVISCQDTNQESSSKELPPSEDKLTSTSEHITYAKDILPILSRSCLPCHNSDSLKDWTDYETVVDNSDAIVRSLNHDAHYKPMPMGRAKLQESDIQMIKDWIESGMEKGNLAVSNKAPQDDFSYARRFYESKCSKCHEDNQNFPGLKGQPRNYIITQLEDFKTGHRSDPTMSYFANDIIKDQEMIELLANYLSELRPCYDQKTSPVETLKFVRDKAASYNNGQQIYLNKCKTCHEENIVSTPSILGLNEKYLVKVLVEMKTNYRSTTAMGRVLLSTTKQEINDLSYYLSKQSDCPQN